MPDTFSHQAIAAVPPKAAWSALQRPTVWEEVAGVEHVRNARHDADGLLLGYEFVVRAGPSSFDGTAETIEALVPTRMHLRISSPEISGSLITSLELVEDAQTLVTVAVEMRANGFLAQMFYPIVAQTVRTGLPAQVQAFAVKLGVA